MNENADNERKAQGGEGSTDPQVALIDLLEHLLHEYWSVRELNQMPRLLPGAIPEGLSVEVPIPDGSRLVGSVAWQLNTTIIFDCNLPRREVVGFYEARLLPEGWTQPEMQGPFRAGGFTHRSWDMGTYFCQGERGPSLYVRTFPGPSGLTSVQVALSTDPEQSPCSPRQRRQFQGIMPPWSSVLPELGPPEGAVQLGGGGPGGNGDSATSKAWLRTGIGLTGVLAHYERQLEGAGWQRVDGGHSGPVAWSTWDFSHEGEGWHGMLMVTKRPWAEDEYWLRLAAEIEGFGTRAGVFFVSDF